MRQFFGGHMVQAVAAKERVLSFETIAIAPIVKLAQAVAKIADQTLSFFRYFINYRSTIPAIFWGEIAFACFFSSPKTALQIIGMFAGAYSALYFLHATWNSFQHVKLSQQQ